jgi:hypothetical protein
VVGGSNDGINGFNAINFNAIKDGGEVKRVIKGGGGDDGGASKGAGGIRGWS